MRERVIDYDPLTRETTTFQYHENGDITLGHFQDIEPILERNKRSFNDDDGSKRGIKQNWLKYASIPNIIAIKWKKELGVDLFNRDHKKKVMQLLNSPDYRYLKTTNKYHDK